VTSIKFQTKRFRPEFPMYIVKSSITQQVMSFLQDRIASGDWKVGEKIPSENELNRELGVSRNSIRLALRQFIALGVLESKHGKGTYLVRSDLDYLNHPNTHLTPEDCTDLVKVVEFRLIVEPEAAALATRHADSGTFDRMRRHVEHLKASVDSLDRYIRHDVAFHVEIGRASANPLLDKTIRALFVKENASRMFTIFRFKGGAVYFHPRILAAMEEGDAAKARRLMRDHIQNVLDQVGSDRNGNGRRKS
jgi:GntR family transcriptional repressor for pyruvate dehydrogenase complex